MTNQKFDDIRPYYDKEIPAAMQRIASSTSFPLLASYVYPDRSIKEVREQIRSYKTIRDFQHEIMVLVNERTIEYSITDFTTHGIEKLDPKKKYLFVSNHRDIMLDSSLMQYELVRHGHETSEITFGANLMQGQLVIDIGKSNKMFRVERPGGSARDFYHASMHLSEYIRHTITEKHDSVWIAQRNGRTKDGCDRTDQGIIKMFGMSGNGSKVDALAELKIVPVAVSYEWEPCDILKAIELYERQSGPYIKKPGEDLNSILTGITQRKGRVHIEFCDQITRADLMRLDHLTINEYNRQVAALLDRRICSAYQLTPNNYIAHDIRYGTHNYADRYTQQEFDAFTKYMQKLAKYDEDCNIEQLVDIFLGIYANPVDSKNRM